MIKILKALFIAIAVSMILATTRAGMHENVLQATARLLKDPWGLATFADAYCGFITFFVWVGYRENNGLSRIVWFILIMLFGNIAMSSYVLMKLFTLPKGAGIEALLLKPTA